MIDMENWSPSDYAEIYSLHMEAAEDYSEDHPNGRLARTLFVSSHNIYDFQSRIAFEAGDAVDERHALQMLYLPRGSSALFSLFWMVKHHYYSTAYSRVRFLLELYLVVRELNRNKERTKKKYENAIDKMKSNKYETYEDTPVTSLFSGIRGNVLGDFKSRHDLYRGLHGQISNFGSHPNTIQASYHDGRRSPEMEIDALLLGCSFAYGLTAQYIRTFEGTEIEKEIHIHLLDIIEDLAITGMPLLEMFDEDLEYALL